MTKNEKYQVVIGLEVHTQLLTQSKLFCGDSAAFSTNPNTHISPISLAHPGTLPKINAKAIEFALKLGLALECDIAQKNYFDRKNYFYPDLPKGYQISQHNTPICKNGRVPIHVNGISRHIKLNRIHLEEDAGKSLHDMDENFSAIDLNRAGVPLLEIVSEPDIFSSEEAFAYISELRKLVTWLEICDGNMEEGSMRCDANISIRLKGETQLGTRVEVKNLNSIRNVKKAIDVEVERLINLTENNQPVVQETRSYDADNNTTFSLRSKEEADDYRYFPEPDLLPLYITDNDLLVLKKELPVLPEALKQRYMLELQLSAYDATVLCDDQYQAKYFEQVIKHTQLFKAVANWLLGPVKNYLNDNQLTYKSFTLPAEKLAALIELVDSGKLNFGNAASKVFPVLLKDSEKHPHQIADELNLIQQSDSSYLEQWVDEVIAALPDQVKAYQAGKKGLIGVFVGEVKKRSKGKADLQIVHNMLANKLKK